MHSLSETCFAEKCWFFSGLWSYSRGSVASRFMAEFHCFVLGYSDCCFCGNSLPLEEPCSVVLPYRPCLRHCAGCCSSRISSVAEQLNFDSLMELHRHFGHFILGSLLRSAWNLGQKCYFGHFAHRLVFWSEIDSWNYWYVEHDGVVSPVSLAGPRFKDVDDVLVEHSCWCSRWRFCHSARHFDWVQALLFGNDYKALKY